MKRENLRKTGSRMEDIAADYLAAHGVRILERNFRSREAEVDIIGRQGSTILFVEVKARAENEKSGTALEAVGPAKQKRICRCADYYLYRNGIDPYSTGIRFDVVAVTMSGVGKTEIDPAENGRVTGIEEMSEEKQVREIRWIRNAFDYAPDRARKPHWRVW